MILQNIDYPCYLILKDYNPKCKILTYVALKRLLSLNLYFI